MFSDCLGKKSARPMGLILIGLLAIFSVDSAHANADIAKRISEGAAITGSRLLIIGFEGLAGFSYSKAAQLETYQCKVSHGMKAGKPIGLGGGHVTSALLVPIVEKHKNKVKTAMFAHSACKAGNCGLPAAIATQWMADAGKENTDGRKIIIVGHSFGGDAAAVLARQLASSNVTVDSVFIIDGRRRPTGMGSVGPKQGSARWVTFYQKTDFFLMGFKVDGAENIFLMALPGIGHIALPHNKKIINSMQEQIGNPPGEEITLAAQDKVEACKDSTLSGMGAYRGTPGIVEAVPVAAVVGGGGYLAYQALKKKKSSGGGGGGDDFKVAAALRGQGKSAGTQGEGGSAAGGSSEQVNLGGSEKTLNSTESIKSETSVVFLPQKDSESPDTSGASREGGDEKFGKAKELARSVASEERPTRFSKDSLLKATGKSSANNIGGATALVEGLAAKDGSGGESLAPAGAGDRGSADREEEDEESEEESADQDSEFQPLAADHEEVVVYEQEILAGQYSQLYARGSLFERVNRKIRQRIHFSR